MTNDTMFAGFLNCGNSFHRCERYNDHKCISFDGIIVSQHMFLFILLTTKSGQTLCETIAK